MNTSMKNVKWAMFVGLEGYKCFLFQCLGLHKKMSSPSRRRRKNYILFKLKLNFANFNLNMIRNRNLKTVSMIV